MRAICGVCQYKEHCAIKNGNRENYCQEVQTSNFGFEEAIEKASEWLLGYFRDTMTPKEFEEFHGKFREAMNK